MTDSKYCTPPATAPFCTTNTWTYSTEDTTGAVTSYWVGVERGCAAVTSYTTDALTSGTVSTLAGSAAGSDISSTTRGFSTATGKKQTQHVRLYAPTNSAAKAKANAKYPTADSGAGTVPASTYVGTATQAGLKTYYLFNAAITTAAKTGGNVLFKGSVSTNTADANDADLINPFIPGFMKADGDGAPDLPSSVKTPELQCVSCVTPPNNQSNILIN